MNKTYPIIIIVFIYLFEFIAAQRQTNVTCPNYSYKCPDCKNEQFCSYPLNHGCERSGVPVCQSKNCHGVVCAAKALPCPNECPFSCEYHGPPCCPFIGQPTCLPICQTLVKCKITPCPSDCPSDCFYPNADYCCPQSGEPVCRSQLEDIGSSQQQNKLLKREKTLASDTTLENTDDGSGDAGPPARPDSALNLNENLMCITMIVPCPPECPNDCEYPTDVPCPQTHPPKCRSTVNPDQNGYTDDGVAEKLNELVNEFTDIVGEEVNVISQLEELLIHEHKLLGWLNQQRKSLTSAHHTSPPHKSSTTTTTTTVRLPSSKICPMIYVHCPELCPTSCIRPPDAPCPFAVPGYCP